MNLASFFFKKKYFDLFVLRIWDCTPSSPSSYTYHCLRAWFIVSLTMFDLVSIHLYLTFCVLGERSWLCSMCRSIWVTYNHWRSPHHLFCVYWFQFQENVPNFYEKPCIPVIWHHAIMHIGKWHWKKPRAQYWTKYLKSEVWREIQTKLNTFHYNSCNLALGQESSKQIVIQ